MNGKVKFFSETKNFGFIIGEDNKDYFVHGSNVNEDAMLTQDKEVEFDVVEGQKGKKAINVKFK